MKKGDCIFCDFISGSRKEHINKFPFLVLRKTKHSVSFLAIDVPKRTKINILVVPKKHFQFVEDVPDSIMKDLMKHVKFLIRALKKKYPGVNIILNDGWDANQRIPHVHFHLYPRKKGDGLYRGFEGRFMRDRNLKELKEIHIEILKLLKNK